jgi:hypothetical protein
MEAASWMEARAVVAGMVGMAVGARVVERVVVSRADARVAAAADVAGPVAVKAEGAKAAEATEAMEVAETVGGRPTP